MKKPRILQNLNLLGRAYPGEPLYWRTPMRRVVPLFVCGVVPTVALIVLFVKYVPL